MKLIFLLPADAEYEAERMWCEVVSRDGDAYVGRLDSQPQLVEGLAAGDEIRFEPRHVVAIHDDSDDRLAPLCGVGLDVLRGDAWPAWVARVAPTDDRDCGWRIFSAREADAGATVAALSVGALFRAWAVLDSVLEPRGDGAWRWDDDACEHVRADALPAPLAAAAAAGLGRVHAPSVAPELKMVVTQRALEVAPVFAQRMEPSENHDDDSGWCAFVGDETDADFEDATVVPVARILHHYPYVERVLGETDVGIWSWPEGATDWERAPDPPDDDED